MKKTIFILGLAFLNSIAGFAQETHLRNSKWYYPSGMGADFNPVYGGYPMQISSSPSTQGFHTCVSDQDGNPLIVTKFNYGSYQIWARHNGELEFLTINNPSDSHGTLIVPRPKHTDRYYIVTSSADGLLYTEVDLANFTVIDKNTPLNNGAGPILSSPEGSGVTSTTHANGTDYWVIASVENMLYSYLVSENGIDANPTSYYSLPTAEPNSNVAVKISPQYNGEKHIAVVNAYTGVSLQNFSDETGDIYGNSSYANTALNGLASGCLGGGIMAKDVEFSADGSVIYSVDTMSIYAVQESGSTWLIPNSEWYVAAQRGPDGNVYFLNGMGYLSRSTPSSMNTLEDTSVSLFSGIGFQQWGALPQLVSINDCLATAVTPTFYNSAYISNGTSASLPIASIEGITGSWSPSALSEGEHTYTFTPSPGQCANMTNKSFWYLKPKTIMANDDYFNNPLSPSAMNPSVLDNDTVNGVTATVTSSFSNVTVSFVSMGGINVPTEAEFSTITGGYHYSDFLTPNGKYYMNSGMFPPGTYYLTYKITQNSCPDNYSIATATIIYGGTSSTGKSVKSNQSPKENELPDIIAVYPNPSNGIFNIDLTHVKESYNNIRVYNILGAKIYEGSLLKSLNQIDLSNVPTGYYVAHISGEENSTTVKLIKN